MERFYPPSLDRPQAGNTGMVLGFCSPSLLGQCLIPENCLDASQETRAEDEEGPFDGGGISVTYSVTLLLKRAVPQPSQREECPTLQSHPFG